MVHKPKSLQVDVDVKGSQIKRCCSDAVFWFKCSNPDINHKGLPLSQAPGFTLPLLCLASLWRRTVLRLHTQSRPRTGYREKQRDRAVPEPSCWLTLFRYQQHLPAATLFNCLSRSHAGYHILFEIIKNNFTGMLLSQRGHSPETTATWII